jgi:hypothetical protein
VRRTRGRHIRGRSWRRRLPNWNPGQWGLALALISAAAAILALPPAYLNGRGGGANYDPQARPAPNPTTSATTVPLVATSTRLTTTGRPPTTTMSAAAAADSISASVEVNPEKTTMFSSANDRGHGLIVPREARIIGGPPGDGCAQFYPWVAERGGVSAEDTYLRLVLQGKGSNAVFLSSMRARIVERRAPLNGIPLWCGIGGAGVNIRFIYLDLDKSPPVGVHGEFSDTRGMLRRKPFGFTLRKNETEVFEIWAVTKKCYCRWVIELDLVVNGTRAVKTVTNNGRPFQTTAWSCCRTYVWTGGAWYVDAGGEPQPRNKPLKPLS